MIWPLRVGARVRLEDPSLPKERQQIGTVIGADYANNLAEVRWDRDAPRERILPVGALALHNEAHDGVQREVLES